MPLPYLIGEEVFNFLSYLNYGDTVADKGGGVGGERWPGPAELQ